MAHPEDIPESDKIVGEEEHTTDHNRITTALRNIDERANNGESANEFPVAAYGAVGDGTTNDAAALNAAAAAAGAVGGVVLLEANKTYGVSVPVNLLSNVTYRGHGASTVIKALAGFTGDAVMDYGSGGRVNVTIERLTVDGNKANTSGNINGINNPASTGMVICDVTVKNTRTRGIHLYDSEGALLDNVRVVDCGVGNDLDVGTYVGIAVEGDNHVVSNTRIVRPSGLGLVISGPSDSVQFDNCRVIDPGYIGIGFGGSNATHVSMTNCTVSGADTGPGIDTGNALHSTVTGCNVYASWAGFVSDSGRWQTFTGCHVDEPHTRHAFDITATPDSNLTGCTAFIGDGGIGRGIMIVLSSRTVVAGCYVHQPHPIWAAFQVYSSDDVTISGCGVTDDRVTPAGTYAFEIAGTSSNCLVTGVNVADILPAYMYQDISSGSGNIAHLVGTGTPESVIAADVGSTFTDRASGVVYRKNTGAGNTGWVAIGSGGGGSVDSVNGEVGTVVLDAADVGAATTAQGALADTAVQPGDLGAVATSNDYGDLDNLPTLGTAAAQNTSAFATAAQGATADTAIQPGDDAADLGSGASADGYVLTSDGAGGAAWEAAAGGSSAGVTLFGSGVPSSGLGSNGDWYRRSDNIGTLYRKISGSWIQVGGAGNWLDFQGGSLPAGFQWSGSRSVELTSSATLAEVFPTNSGASGFSMSGSNPTVTLTNGTVFGGKYGTLGGFTQAQILTMPGAGQTLRVALGLDGAGTQDPANMIPSVVINNAGSAQVDAFFTTNLYTFPVAVAANHYIGFRLMAGGCFVFHLNSSSQVQGSVFIPQNLLLAEIIPTYPLAIGAKGYGQVKFQNTFWLTEAF